MKNVYDILVNFKKNAYEFYEWDREDEIKHIKITPVLKVSSNCILDFLNNNIKVDESFLKKIKGKTEIFYGRMVKFIDYACVIYSEEIALALMFDKNGIVTGKSKLLFDEMDDIILSGRKEEVSEINYQIISLSNCNNNLTRRENKLIFILTKYLKSLFENKAYEEIKYFHFECFNDRQLDNNKAYQRLKTSVINADYDVINKLKSLIKVVKK